MHCSWWQAVKMTLFAHCPNVSLSAGMSALTWLPTTHCNQFFFCLLYSFFFLSLHGGSVFKNSRLWTEKVLTIWLEYVSIVNINQFCLIRLHQYIYVKHSYFLKSFLEKLCILGQKNFKIHVVSASALLLIVIWQW